MQVLIKLVVEMKFIFFVQVCDVFCDSFFELTNNIVFVYTVYFKFRFNSYFATKRNHMFRRNKEAQGAGSFMAALRMFFI